MSKIDVSQWGKFKLSDMFDITYGSFVPKKMRGTKTPFITTTSSNNGIAYYVDSDPMFDRDALTVASDGSVGATFYHDKPFSAGNIAVVMEPRPATRDSWSPASALFLATVIRRYAEIKYGWTNKFSVNRVREAVVHLPVTSAGTPDWDYMDSYIDNLAERAHREVTSLACVKRQPHRINIDQWGEFKVGELFEKVAGGSNGARLNAYISDVQDSEHSLPLIGAKKGNNGIVHYGDPSKFASYQQCIGVIQDGAASAGLIYPEYGKFGIYNNAYVIKLQNREMSNEELLYLTAIIQKSVFDKYSYDNKCTWDRVRKDHIKLPVDANGNPDWSTMRSSVEDLAALAHRSVTSLRSLTEA